MIFIYLRLCVTQTKTERTRQADPHDPHFRSVCESSNPRISARRRACSSSQRAFSSWHRRKASSNRREWPSASRSRISRRIRTESGEVIAGRDEPEGTSRAKESETTLSTGWSDEELETRDGTRRSCGDDVRASFATGAVSSDGGASAERLRAMGVGRIVRGIRMDGEARLSTSIGDSSPTEIGPLGGCRRRTRGPGSEPDLRFEDEADAVDTIGSTEPPSQTWCAMRHLLHFREFANTPLLRYAGPKQVSGWSTQRRHCELALDGRK
jgi:hypothetical protein